MQVFTYVVQFIQCGVQGVKQLHEGGTPIEANTDGHILVGCAGSIVYTCGVSYGHILVGCAGSIVYTCGLRRQYSIYLRGELITCGVHVTCVNRYTCTRFDLCGAVHTMWGAGSKASI